MKKAEESMLNDGLLDGVSGGNDVLNELNYNRGISCDSDLKNPGIVIPEEKNLEVKDPEPEHGTSGGGAGLLDPESSSLIIVG